MVLSNRPSLLSVLPMGNTAVQRPDSTKCSERKPSEKIGAIEPPFAVLIVGKRSSSMAPSILKEALRKSWRCRTAPLLSSFSGKCSGSVASIFLKRHSSENLVLWNRPSLLSVFEMDDTAVQNHQVFSRFGKFGSIEPPPRCCLYL